LFHDFKSYKQCVWLNIIINAESIIDATLMITKYLACFFLNTFKLIHSFTFKFIVNQVQRDVRKIPTQEETFGMQLQGEGIEATRVQLILLVG
jgi:hypothetical protein